MRVGESPVAGPAAGMAATISPPWARMMTSTLLQSTVTIPPITAGSTESSPRVDADAVITSQTDPEPPPGRRVNGRQCERPGPIRLPPAARADPQSAVDTPARRGR